MRELKFRVWIYDGEDLSSGGIVDVETAFLKDYVVAETRTIKPTDKCTILMQYTGLRDRICKEIYEGDIVSTPAGVGWIEWRGGCYHLCWDGPASTTLHDCQTGDLEVIGNIHETPELLGGQI